LPRSKPLSSTIFKTLTEQVFSEPRHADGPAALLAPVPKVALFFLYDAAIASADEMPSRNSKRR
jgi:hypothetical protein